MDKNFLLRLENSLQTIARDLLLNKEIRKLLFYDTNTIEAKFNDEHKTFDQLEDPGIELVKGNIFLQPIVEVDNAPPFNKKTFISITSPNMSFEALNSIEYAVKISVQVDKTDWVFEKNKIRVYRLAQEIINTIDGKKYSCSLELNFEQMIETIIDKTITGKSLLFSIGDGVGDDE